MQYPGMRQWGHWLARNTINTKQKVGLGAKKVKKKNDPKSIQAKKIMARGASRSVTQPIKRNFPKRRVISHLVDDIWCSDLVEMQKLSKWNKG